MPPQGSGMSRGRRLWEHLHAHGSSWTFVYVVYALCRRLAALCERLVTYFESRLLVIERRKFLTGDATISAHRNTFEDNKRIWTDYDWSQGGEEWTSDAKRHKGLDPERWKESLLDGMMFKYIERNSTVLEIGPGAGRWTQFLVPMSRRLLLADTTEKCLSLCRERFKSHVNIEYYLVTEENGLCAIASDSVDYVWSYDVFVHINPPDTERYVAQFSRILRPGGCAIIHHAGAGNYGSEAAGKREYRSNVSGESFAHFVNKYGMELVEQDGSKPHYKGDLITVFRKPFQAQQAESLCPTS